MSLQSAAFIAAGVAIIAFAVCDWWARRKGKVCPIKGLFDDGVHPSSTPMVIFERFEIVFYLLFGALLVIAGLALNDMF